MPIIHLSPQRNIANQLTITQYNILTLGTKIFVLDIKVIVELHCDNYL